MLIRACLRSLKHRPIVSAYKVLKGCVPVKAQKLPLSENDVATFFRSCKKSGVWCVCASALLPAKHAPSFSQVASLFQQLEGLLTSPS